MATGNDAKIKALEKQLEKKKTLYRKNLDNLLSKSSLTEAQKSKHRNRHNEEIRALKREILTLKAKV